MIVLTVFVLIVGALWAFSTMIYNDNINQRFESYKPLMFKVEDFEGLKCTNYKFSSYLSAKSNRVAPFGK